MICAASGPRALPAHQSHSAHPAGARAGIAARDRDVRPDADRHAEAGAADGRDRLLFAGSCKEGHGGLRHRARVTGWVWHGRLAPRPPQLR